MGEGCRAGDEDRLARVAWGRLAEPCDLQAGALTQGLGHGDALRWLREGAGPPPVDAPWGQDVWARARARWRPRLAGLDPEREIAGIARVGGSVVVPGDETWPVALDDLEAAAPHCLWVRGDPALLVAGDARRDASGLTGAVAIVGARASTGYGEHVTGELAASLADSGLAVVSGGAFGIDAVAHRTALAVGGPTVAVMAGGLDRFYPAGNADLLARVAREGAVVAELGPGSSPSRSRFLTRNRLIAALAQVCVVVEAGWRSGTLSTAMHAARLLRPVAAVPGPVTSAASAGCHRLIREGVAVCVSDAAQVRELLPGGGETLAAEPDDAAVRRAGDVPAGVSTLDARVWEALPARGGASIDSLVRVAGAAPGAVRAALGSLELAGHVRREGDRYRRTAR
ncbi:DNA-processing protein DprA [Litorihabitans aurantiacus]|uniref:DNA processing protein DprA n=1 Tax=Litorihabitans aurantiacus TaxID=1930061 RepID=A0AA37XFL8_9MICO|nr:DNA-processing protein DprA [Litorihabitans aurantiacus]GMA31805.1 DNA processing protein DprA [Litorihabitans aurantiacus]